MSFSAWRSAIEPDLGAKPELKANYLNLLAEDRVPQMTSFQTSIGTQFVSSLSQNSADAELCLSSHLQLLGGVDSSWLGLLPSISQDHEKWRAVTYVSARHIEKYIDPNFDSTIRPLPPRVTVPQPVYSDSMGNPIKRFIWVTSVSSTFNLSPTEIVLSLGFEPRVLEELAVAREVRIRRPAIEALGRQGGDSFVSLLESHLVESPSDDDQLLWTLAHLESVSRAIANAASVRETTCSYRTNIFWSALNLARWH